jgi:hypothetical protein
MKPDSKVAQTVADALGSFERMFVDGLRRREVLQAELALLRAKKRVMQVTDETHWLVTQYIRPRESELGVLEARLEFLQAEIREVRQKVTQLPAASPRVDLPSIVWVETGTPHILSLAA